MAAERAVSYSEKGRMFASILQASALAGVLRIFIGKIEMCTTVHQQLGLEN